LNNLYSVVSEGIKKGGTSSPKNADNYCFNRSRILLSIDLGVKLIVFNIILNVLKGMIGQKH